MVLKTRGHVSSKRIISMNTREECKHILSHLKWAEVKAHHRRMSSSSDNDFEPLLKVLFYNASLLGLSSYGDIDEYHVIAMYELISSHPTNDGGDSKSNHEDNKASMFVVIEIHQGSCPSCRGPTQFFDDLSGWIKERIQRAFIAPDEETARAYFHKREKLTYSDI